MTPSSRFHTALENRLRHEAKPEEKFGHQPRLYALTREIGRGFAYDDDVVCAASYLHDLGVFTGHRPEDRVELARWDHVAYTMVHAPSILREIGFPEEKIHGVLAVIRDHQPKDNPATFEGVLVRDADILEQLGAIGILRTVAKIGRDTRFPTFTAAAAALEHALLTLPQAIRLARTRELAAPRIAFLAVFLKAVQQEAGGRLY